MVIATDVGLDGVEIADEGYTLLGNWRGTGSGDLDQFTAGVGPAIGQINAGPDRSGAIRRLYPA